MANYERVAHRVFSRGADRAGGGSGVGSLGALAEQYRVHGEHVMNIFSVVPGDSACPRFGAKMADEISAIAADRLADFMKTHTSLGDL